MFPADLEASTLDLPSTDSYPIIVITGHELRHDRFALRLQAEFPGLVTAWLQIGPAAQLVNAAPRGELRQLYDAFSWMLIGGLKTFNSSIGRRLANDRARHLLSRFGRRLLAIVKKSPESQSSVEQQMFGHEIAHLRGFARIAPKVIREPNAPETIALVRSLNPYFIVTSGVTIFGEELRGCARGLALNLHNGWLPSYRGNDPTVWALYHRQLSNIASTVHILTNEINSGPILRRSSVCLAVDDTPESCLARSVALGTELMCEILRECIRTGKAQIFSQPQFSGYTHLRRHLDEDVRAAITRDLQNGLIGAEINRWTHF